MLSRVLVVALTALAGLASAQNFSSPAGCCNLDPGSVSLGMRQSWCQAEHNSCTQLCGGAGQASSNDCDAGTLNYTCSCFNGKKYNISDYGQTLPSLECEQWVIQCVNNHPNDLDGITMCHSVTCGSKNASAVAQVSSSSSSSSPSSTSSSASSSSGGSSAQTSAASSSSSSGIAAAVHVAEGYGTGIVGAILFGLFGFVI